MSYRQRFLASGFTTDKVVLFLFFGQGEDVVNRAVAFSAEAEKAGIVGERNGALERPDHPSTNDIEEVVFLKQDLLRSWSKIRGSREISLNFDAQVLRFVYYMGNRLIRGAETRRYDETSRSLERSLIGIVVIGHAYYILLTRVVLRK